MPEPITPRPRWIVPRRGLLPAAALALGLLTACGSNETSEAVSASPSNSADGATAASGDDAAAQPADGADEASSANFPDVEVYDLGSGDTVVLSDQLSGGSLPTLIWFWAPH